MLPDPALVLDEASKSGVDLEVWADQYQMFLGVFDYLFELEGHPCCSEKHRHAQRECTRCPQCAGRVATKRQNVGAPIGWEILEDSESNTRIVLAMETGEEYNRTGIDQYGGADYDYPIGAETNRLWDQLAASVRNTPFPADDPRTDRTHPTATP